MPRRDVTDQLRHDVLVDIPKGQERRFGTGGKMLKPRRASVARRFVAPRKCRAATQRGRCLPLHDQTRADGDRRGRGGDRALVAHHKTRRRDDDLFPRRHDRPGAAN